MSKTFNNKFYRHVIVLLLMMVLPGIGKAQKVKRPGHIVFIENSWQDALRQSKLQNKYIFVDAYASWCGPCKMLKAITFHNKKAADFYNSNFINVSIDMEKGEGPQLAYAWNIQAYPTLIIFDASGKPVLGTVGYMGAADLIKFGKQALDKQH